MTENIRNQLLVCASPVLFSYFTYYVIKPSGGSTNYGALIDPQRPMPAAQLIDERAQPQPLTALRGKWLMLMTDASACDEACARKLLSVPDAIYPQFATHNAHTLSAIYQIAGQNYYPGQYEFQCLHAT